MKRIVLILLVCITWSIAFFNPAAGRVNIEVREPTIKLPSVTLDTIKNSSKKQKKTLGENTPFYFLWKHYKSITNVNFIENNTIGISRCKTEIKYWDVQTGKLIKTLKQETNKYAFSETSNIMVYISGSEYRSNIFLTIINAKTGELIKKQKLKTYVSHLSMNSAGSIVAYTQKGKRNDILNIYNIKNKNMIYSDELNDEVGRYGVVYFKQDSDILAIHLYDSRHLGGTPVTKLLNARTGQVIQEFKGDVKSLDFNPTRNIFSILTNKNLTLYDIKSGKEVLIVPNQSKYFHYAFGDDGKFLIVKNRNAKIKYTIKNFDTNNLKEMKETDFIEPRMGLDLIDADSGLIFATYHKKMYLYEFDSIKLLKIISLPYGMTPEKVYAPGRLLLINGGNGYVNNSNLGIFDFKSYHNKLAKKVSNSIDTSNYIALYEFTKKFYNKFDVVQKAYRDIYNAVIKEDTLEAYEWYISVLKKTIDNEGLIKDHIDGYYWYQKHFDSSAADELKIISKKLNTLRQAKYIKEYEAVKKENNLAIYDYYASSHTDPKADNLQDAVNAVQKLAFVKAKEINTISAYNTFIFAYPYADEVEEANRLAYELEKTIYTDIGMMGFFGKEEKMNKQARKLLIKAKKILEDTVPNGELANQNDIGVYIVVERMYRLAQKEFSDTDAVLTLVESDKLKSFKNKLKQKLEERNYGRKKIASNSIEDELDSRGEAVYYIFNEAPNIDMGMKQFYKEEREKASAFIKNANKIAQKEFDTRNRKVREKQEAFEKLYKKQVSEYKPEPVKVENLDLSGFERKELKRNLNNLKPVEEKREGVIDIKQVIKRGDNQTTSKKKVFWNEVSEIAKLKGDVAVGKASFSLCSGCHTDQALNLGGVIPPKLEHAGSIYDKNYLIALIKDPAIASNVDHKYTDTMMHPMGSIKVMLSDNQQIADVVEYILKEKSTTFTEQEVFMEACSRCHSMEKDKLSLLGKMPKFKHKKDELRYQIKIEEEKEYVQKYLGVEPLDLSNIRNTKTVKNLQKFILNPQSYKKDTSMPTLGLSKEGIEKIISYLGAKEEDKVKSSNLSKSQRVVLTNKVMEVSIDYQEDGKNIRFDISATNKGLDAKGGVSLSFPRLQNKSLVTNINNNGFSSVDVYGAGSKVWNGKKKKQIISDYLLVESWSKVWRSGETKTMHFSIEKSQLNGKSFNVRGLILHSKQEYVVPQQGMEDQQGYKVKRIGINFLISNTKVQNNIPINQKNYPPSNNRYQLYYRQQTVIPVIVNRKDIGTVGGISRNGDGFIAIRSGPDGKYKMIDKFYRNAEKVIITDTKGKWKGVVYGDSNCLPDLSKQRAKPYEGACKTGWVYGKYVNEEYITTAKRHSSSPAHKSKQKSKKVRQLNYKVLGVKSLKVLPGMHFVKVKVGGKRKEFSLYCPTNTIEDTTNKHHKIERNIQLERKLPYNDSQMVVNMFNKICKKEVRVETLDELLGL